MYFRDIFFKIIILISKIDFFLSFNDLIQRINIVLYFL